MKSLNSLIKVLRPSEKRLLLHYYSRNTNAEEKLRLKLFRIIQEGKATTDAEARELLNGAGGPSAYSHLKARLKNDILNVLLTQDTSKRLAQPNRAAELDCRKKVAQSHLLLLRGAQLEGMNVLNKALKTADKFELLAERLQINHLLREKFLGAGSTKELKRLNKVINADMKRYEDLLFVEQQSFVLSSPDFSKNLRSKAKQEGYLELIDNLGKLYRKHRLARIGFWYYMAATEYYAAKDNYGEVVQLGLKFLRLVERSPAVKSKNNIAGVNQTVGTGYLELRDFEDAKKHLEKSEKLFASTGFNRLACLQLKYMAQVAMNDPESGLATVGSALAHPRIERREHLLPRWLYFKACAEFLAGDFDESLKSLNRDGYLLKQRDDWNIQFRIFEMLLLIELKDEEWLEFKLDTTRKFLTRHKKLVNARVRMAIDVISNLQRKDLDFTGLTDDNRQKVKLAITEDKGYKWSPEGPEIVRVDYWVQSKLDAAG